MKHKKGILKISIVRRPGGSPVDFEIPYVFFPETGKWIVEGTILAGSYEYRSFGPLATKVQERLLRDCFEKIDNGIKLECL